MTVVRNTQQSSDTAEWLARAEEMEARAALIEGDSDNPLRVAAANNLFAQAAALRSRAQGGAA